MRNRLPHVDGAVRRAGRARPDVALGLEGIIIRVKSLVGDDVIGAVVAVVNGGNRRDHLVDRSGRIGSEKGSVIQRRIFVLAQLLEILAVGAEVKGRIARAGEYLAGFHLLDHDCAALGVLALLVFADAVFAQIENDLLECLLGGRLQGDIDRGFHVVARLGHFCIVFA